MIKYLFCIAILVSLISSVLGDTNSWNTLYSLEDEKVYVHLKNNDLVVLNFSLTGFGSSSSGNLDSVDLNLQDGQSVTLLASPPSNSSLFILSGQLYGFISANGENTLEKDMCGDGVLGLIKYYSDSNEWREISGLNFNGIDDASFYQYSTYLTEYGDDIMYIYGGICSSDDSVTNRLLSFNSSSMSFSNITTSTKPQAFYGAANILAPNPKTQLVVGGESGNGWLNMMQLATWDFSSGWSFAEISTSSEGLTIESRKFGLILPIFDPLSSNSDSVILNELKVNSVLLLGGEGQSGDAEPSISQLNITNNNWVWSSVNSSKIEVSTILGAATIFNTIVTISEDNTLHRRSDGESYVVNLYSTQDYQPVKSLKTNVQSYYHNSSSSKKSTDSILGPVLGSIIPAVVICIGVLLYFGYRRWTKKTSESFDKESDGMLQFGAYFEDLSHIEPKPCDRSNPFDNESSSTLDNASMDSWYKKRKEFDNNRTKMLRNSFNGSNDTLRSNDSHPTSLGGTRRKLHKAVSFSESPIDTFSPITREDSILERNSRYEKQSALRSSTERHFDRRSIIHEHTSSEVSVDDNIDAQILVSSKRRSILRVINPDIDTESFDTLQDPDLIIEDLHSSASSSSVVPGEVRQRVPSSEKEDN